MFGFVFSSTIRSCVFSKFSRLFFLFWISTEITYTNLLAIDWETTHFLINCTKYCCPHASLLSAAHSSRSLPFLNYIVKNYVVKSRKKATKSKEKNQLKKLQTKMTRFGMCQKKRKNEKKPSDLISNNKYSPCSHLFVNWTMKTTVTAPRNKTIEKKKQRFHSTFTSACFFFAHLYFLARGRATERMSRTWSVKWTAEWFFVSSV